MPRRTVDTLINSPSSQRARPVSSLYATSSLEGDGVLMAMFVFTLVAASFLLLLHIYTLCFLKRVVSPCDHASGSTAPPRIPSATETLAGDADDADATTGTKSSGGIGLEAPTVASLPTFTGGSDEEPADCMVCLGALEGDGVGRVLPRCKHAFHAGCISEWLTSHSICCPICRTPVWSDEASTAASSVAVAVSSDEVAGSFGGRVTTNVVTTPGGSRFDVYEQRDDLHLALLVLH